MLPRLLPSLLPVVAVVTAVSLTACNQAEPTATPASEAATDVAAPAAPETKITTTRAVDIPEAVRAAALRVRPALQIIEAELKEREGRRYYDVEGTVDGAEVELDLLETPQGWQVVEIQRDIDWAAAPATVRAAAERARARFAPVRVIESTQAADGAVIYELFAEGQPATPALEVKVEDGKTEVLKETWPH